MKTTLRRILYTTFLLALLSSMALPALSCATASGDLVEQDLDYTENPTDIPNPDRGFYRANDGMIVPVTGAGEGTMEVGSQPVDVSETGVIAGTRVSHVYFDLRYYSGNSFLSRGEEYDEDYLAPSDVEIGEGKEYETHFAYWLENVVPTWPHGDSIEITEDGLNYIRQRLQEVRDGEGVTLVRFNYDGRGHGWVSTEHPVDGYIDQLIGDVEPPKDVVLRHIEQLKPVLHEFEDVIMAVDAGFFGPWGEMHSTTFGTSPEANAWLLNGLLDAVPESRSIIVQGGAFLSWYNATYGTDYTFANFDQIPAPQPGTPEARFGFFNDSYGYGADEGEEDYPDDWGSLSEGAWWPGDPFDGENYDRGKLMTWIRGQNSFYGGEAQGDETLWNTYPFVGFEASYAQTVYLNADYEDVVHQRWADFEYTEPNVTQTMTNAYNGEYAVQQAIFDPVYDGRNGLEYWRDRLGYRLVVREAAASASVSGNGGELRFEGKIQNVGFGNIVNKKDVSVILKSKSGGDAFTIPTDLDARDWRPDLDSRATNAEAYRSMSFSVTLDGVPAGEYDIFLKINDPLEQSANKRSIRFANNGDIWNAELGANRIGSTTVTE